MSSRLLVAAIVAVIAASGATLVARQPNWEERDPVTVVVLSDDEIAFANSWKCNPERVRELQHSEQQFRLRFEYRSGPHDAHKFCAIGDCGIGYIGPPDYSNVDPDKCERRFNVTEPIGARTIVVNGAVKPIIDLRP